MLLVRREARQGINLSMSSWTEVLSTAETMLPCGSFFELFFGIEELSEATFRREERVWRSLC